MKPLFLPAIMNDYIKTTRQCNNQFFLFFKGMATSHLPTGHIIDPIGSFNFKGNMIEFFDEGKVAPRVQHFRQFNYFYIL